MISREPAAVAGKSRQHAETVKAANRAGMAAKFRQNHTGAWVAGRKRKIEPLK